jgi:hypothetical protein
MKRVAKRIDKGKTEEIRKGSKKHNLVKEIGRRTWYFGYLDRRLMPKIGRKEEYGEWSKREGKKGKRKGERK